MREHRVPAAIPSEAVVNVRTHVRYANKRDGTNQSCSCASPVARRRLLPSAGFRHSRRRLQSIGSRAGARHGVHGSTPAPASSSCTRRGRQVVGTLDLNTSRGCGETGIRDGFRSHWAQARGGSNPLSRTPTSRGIRAVTIWRPRARRGRSVPRRSCVALLRSRPYSSSAARVWGPGGSPLARDCRSAPSGTGSPADCPGMPVRRRVRTARSAVIPNTRSTSSQPSTATSSACT